MRDLIHTYFAEIIHLDVLNEYDSNTSLTNFKDTQTSYYRLVRYFHDSFQGWFCNKEVSLDFFLENQENQKDAVLFLVQRINSYDFDLYKNHFSCKEFKDFYNEYKEEEKQYLEVKKDLAPDCRIMQIEMPLKTELYFNAFMSPGKDGKPFTILEQLNKANVQEKYTQHDTIIPSELDILQFQTNRRFFYDPEEAKQKDIEENAYLNYANYTVLNLNQIKCLGSISLMALKKERFDNIFAHLGEGRWVSISKGEKGYRLFSTVEILESEFQTLQKFFGDQLTLEQQTTYDKKYSGYFIFRPKNYEHLPNYGVALSTFFNFQQKKRSGYKTTGKQEWTGLRESPFENFRLSGMKDKLDEIREGFYAGRRCFHAECINYGELDTLYLDSDYAEHDKIVRGLKLYGIDPYNLEYLESTSNGFIMVQNGNKQKSWVSSSRDSSENAKWVNVIQLFGKQELERKKTRTIQLETTQTDLKLELIDRLFPTQGQVVGKKEQAAYYQHSIILNYLLRRFNSPTLKITGVKNLAFEKADQIQIDCMDERGYSNILRSNPKLKKFDISSDIYLDKNGKKEGAYKKGQREQEKETDFTIGMRRIAAPVINRNQWLKVNDYEIDYSDDYDQKAAQYLIKYFLEYDQEVLQEKFRDTKDIKAQAALKFIQTLERRDVDQIFSVLNAIQNDDGKTHAFLKKEHRMDHCFYYIVRSEKDLKYFQSKLEALENDDALFPFSHVYFEIIKGYQADHLIDEIKDILKRLNAQSLIMKFPNSSSDEHTFKEYSANFLDKNVLAAIKSSNEQYDKKQKKEKKLKETEKSVSPLSFDFGEKSSRNKKIQSSDQVSLEQERVIEIKYQKGTLVQFNKTYGSFEDPSLGHIKLPEELVTRDSLLDEEDQALFDQFIDAGNNNENIYYTSYRALTPNKISKMTRAAFQKLKDNHAFMAGGLTLSNLPRGFWTQRDHEGNLVLCYDKLFGYATHQNFYTLDFLSIVKKAKKNKWKNIKDHEAERFLENQKRCLAESSPSTRDFFFNEENDLSYLLLEASRTKGTVDEIAILSQADNQDEFPRKKELWEALLEHAEKNTWKAGLNRTWDAFEYFYKQLSDFGVCIDTVLELFIANMNQCKESVNIFTLMERVTLSLQKLGSLNDRIDFLTETKNRTHINDLLKSDLPHITTKIFKKIEEIVSKEESKKEERKAAEKKLSQDLIQFSAVSSILITDDNIEDLLTIVRKQKSLMFLIRSAYKKGWVFKFNIPYLLSEDFQLVTRKRLASLTEKFSDPDSTEVYKTLLLAELNGYLHAGDFIPTLTDNDNFETIYLEKTKLINKIKNIDEIKKAHLLLRAIRSYHRFDNKATQTERAKLMGKKLAQLMQDYFALSDVRREEFDQFLINISHVDDQKFQEEHTDYLIKKLTKVLKTIGQVETTNKTNQEISDEVKSICDDVFSQSINGVIPLKSYPSGYRKIETSDSMDKLLMAFNDQEKCRIEALLNGHVIVKHIGIDKDKNFQSIIQLFVKLKRSNAKIDELAYLLDALEKLPKENCYWTSTNFDQLLSIFARDGDAPFMVSMLSIILGERADISDTQRNTTKYLGVAASKATDEGWEESKEQLQTIIHRVNQMAITAPLKLKLLEMIVRRRETSSYDKLFSLIGKIDASQFGNPLVMEKVIDDLFDLSSENTNEFNKRMQSYENLLSLIGKDTSSTYLKGMIEILVIKDMLNGDMKTEDSLDVLKDIRLETQKLNKEAVYIALMAAQFDSDRNLSKKEIDMINEIYGKLKDDQYKRENIEKLKSAFDTRPRPNVYDIRELLEGKEHFAFIRHDYKGLGVGRQIDFDRIVNGLFTEDTARNKATGLFDQLKKIERDGYAQPDQEKKCLLSDMDDESLLSLLQDEDNRNNKPLYWAVLFEIFYRTTGKYPHLAQQIGLLCADLFDEKNQGFVLKLATGEGKSIFSILLSADQALQNRYEAGEDEKPKKVVVMTENHSLSFRDYTESLGFFEKLGFTSSYIMGGNRYEEDQLAAIDKSQIVYSTFGTLSLFLSAIHINLDQGIKKKYQSIFKNSTAIIDECDSLIFYEWLLTQYNFSVSQNIKIEDYLWLYNEAMSYINDQKGSDVTVLGFKEHLKDQGISDYQGELLKSFDLSELLESVINANTLEKDSEFAIEKVRKSVDGELYNTKRIVPLSDSQQMMHGAKFSRGVHEVLSLQHQAHVGKKTKKISSVEGSVRFNQTFEKLYGLTATMPYHKNAQVKNSVIPTINMPTNHFSLRAFQDPEFFDSSKTICSRITEIAKETEGSSLVATHNGPATLSIKSEILGAEEQGFEQEIAGVYYIFYLNSSECLLGAKKQPMNPSEVLEYKKILETQGKKVVLVSASHERGANVGVNAVMIPWMKKEGASDFTGFIQKAGRTARNKAVGKVYHLVNTKTCGDLIQENGEKRMIDWKALQHHETAKKLQVNQLIGCLSLAFEEVTSKDNVFLRSTFSNLLDATQVFYHGDQSESSEDLKIKIIKELREEAKTLDKSHKEEIEQLIESFRSNYQKLVHEIQKDDLDLTESYQLPDVKDFDNQIWNPLKKGITENYAVDLSDLENKALNERAAYHHLISAIELLFDQLGQEARRSAIGKMIWIIIALENLGEAQHFVQLSSEFLRNPQLQEKFAGILSFIGEDPEKIRSIITDKKEFTHAKLWGDTFGLLVIKDRLNEMTGKELSFFTEDEQQHVGILIGILQEKSSEENQVERLIEFFKRLVLRYNKKEDAEKRIEKLLNRFSQLNDFYQQEYLRVIDTRDRTAIGKNLLYKNFSFLKRLSNLNFNLTLDSKYWEVISETKDDSTSFLRVLKQIDNVRDFNEISQDGDYVQILTDLSTNSLYKANLGEKNFSKFSMKELLVIRSFFNYLKEEGGEKISLEKTLSDLFSNNVSREEMMGVLAYYPLVSKVVKQYHEPKSANKGFFRSRDDIIDQLKVFLSSGDSSAIPISEVYRQMRLIDGLTKIIDWIIDDKRGSESLHQGKIRNVLESYRSSLLKATVIIDNKEDYKKYLDYLSNIIGNSEDDQKINIEYRDDSKQKKIRRENYGNFFQVLSNYKFIDSIECPYISEKEKGKILKNAGITLDQEVKTTKRPNKECAMF